MYSITLKRLALRASCLKSLTDPEDSSFALHLGEVKLQVPALSTIKRILKGEGPVTPQPKKRPEAYITRLEAV